MLLQDQVANDDPAALEPLQWYELPQWQGKVEATTAMLHSHDTSPALEKLRRTIASFFSILANDTLLSLEANRP